MALNIPDLRVRSPDRIQPDFSWLDALASAGGDIIGEMGMRKSMGKLGATLTTGAPAVQPQGSFLSRMLGDAGQQPAASPAPSVGRSAVPNQPPIPGIQMQASSLYGNNGIDVVATENYIRQAAQARGIDPDVAVRVARSEGLAPNTWQSNYVKNGKRETSYGPFQLLVGGGLGDKFQKVYGKSPADPSTLQQQIDFALDEAAQGGWSPWYGAAKVGVGPRTGLEQARALGYQAGPTTAAEAVTAMGEGGTVPGYVDPMVSAPNSRQQMPVNQMADASGNVLAPAVTPVQRGSISPDTIREFLQDPNLRQIGIDLWKQNVQGPQAGEPWQFVTLPDGTLARANQQTGAVERVGNFAKPKEPQSLINLGDGRLFDPNNREVIDAGGNRKKAPQIVELFDDQTGQPYKARWNEETGQFDRVGGVKAPSGTQLSVGADGSVTMTQGNLKGEKFTEAQSKDNVYATRAEGALATADAYADNLASYGNALLDNDPTGVARGQLQNPDYQVARAAADEFLQAILRKDTGAAITEGEQVLYGRTYFPVPGDGPEVRSYKQQARRRALEALKAGMSPAQIVATERALAKSNGINLDAPARSQPAPANAPAVGAVEEGYRFKGGDPSNPNSWEKVN